MQRVMLWLCVGLSACSGNYGSANGAGSGLNDNGGGPTPKSATVEEYFASKAASNLNICRSCHVAGGVADTDKGKRFMLTSNPANDYVNLKTSWEVLGKGVETNRILTKASNTDAESHTGGVQWSKDGPAYNSIKLVLSCWNDPANCAGLLGNTGPGGGDTTPLLSLLGSKHARHIWDVTCAGETEASTKPLPQDPRTKVLRGFNKGNAVYFNAYYEDCHVNLPEEPHPKTCGDFLKRRNSGEHFLKDELPVASKSQDAFNQTYTKWGMSAYPDNFDQLYTLRYGLNQAPSDFDNPYTRPDGSTGQLPIGLRRMKDGQIGTAACFQCHGGQIGEPNLLKMENVGLGNNNYDVLIDGQDASAFSGTPLAQFGAAADPNALFNIGIKQRGQNNAVGAFELLITMLDSDSLGFSPNLAKTMVGQTGPQDIAHPLAHTQDTPAWWNFGSRPRKFFDAGVSNDSTRIIMAAGPGEFSSLLTPDGLAYRTRIEQYDQDLAAFFLSLKSPDYPQGYCTNADGSAVANAKPNCIDRKLAEAGAILFHSKDLWAEAGNKNRPKPLGGNGSCASCHGAYSPRYVNDKTYLVDPSLEGVAAHISPLDVIGTDRARSDMLTPTLRQRWDSTYWGYPDNVKGWVAPKDKNYLTETMDDMYPEADSPLAVAGGPSRPKGVCNWEKEIIGYQAPPLYGVWATAPYLHNGSVPTVAAVLDSSLRKPIWQRKLETVDGITGFDQSLERAYDYSAMGWKSDPLTCDQMPGTQAMNCSPSQDQGPSLTQLAQNLLNSSVSWTGLVSIPDPTPKSIDKRLVYDTRILGNGNGGHTFTDALTPQERKAIIEYLKTL